MPLDYEKTIERSVDSLQKLYAVIIALALGQAIVTFLTGTGPGSAQPSLASMWDATPMLVAFGVTLVPFFHGMNRHLDHCYLEKTSGVIEGALLFDFAVFFIEAGLLFGAAWSVKVEGRLYVLLGLLLVVDMFWGFVSHLIHYRGHTPSILRWSVINFVAIGLALFVGLANVYPPGLRRYLLMVVAVGRTVADYRYCWAFYFPKGNKATA